jgi:molybdopterin molybdotransferase
MVTDALGKADTIWISGGSSVGTRDITLDVLETLPDFKLLMHGVSVSPGKPTIMARAGTKPVVGLPGHVSSAMIVAYIFMLPLLCRLSGENRPPFINLKNRVDAILGKNIDSASGREEYVRVRLVQEGERLVADPIFGKSGLISPLVDADGLVCVDMNTEGLYEGQKVKVMLF